MRHSFALFFKGRMKKRFKKIVKTFKYESKKVTVVRKYYHYR